MRNYAISQETRADPFMSEKERRAFAKKLLVVTNIYFEKVNTEAARERKAESAKQHAASVDYFTRTGQLLRPSPPPPAHAEQILQGWIDEQLGVVRPALIELSKAVDKIIRQFAQLGYQKGYLFNSLLRSMYSHERVLPIDTTKAVAQRLRADGNPAALWEIVVSETQKFIDTVEIFELEETREDRVQYLADKIYFRAFKLGLSPVNAI